MSKKKIELLKECTKVLKKDAVAKWYKENLEAKSQYNTINDLEFAVQHGNLSVREALSIALIVGLQWSEKFEGVP